MKKIIIDRNYFNDGDYTEWYENAKNEGFKGTYEEYLDWLINEYDYIEVTEDGCMYGYKDNTTYDISYNEFTDKETFFELAKEYNYIIEEI